MPGNLEYSLRMLRRSPGFTLTAVVTLALGIGANVAIFSVLDAVLLRPLPFAQPERLVYGWGKTRGTDSAGIAPTAFRDYRAQSHAFEQLAAISIFGSNAPLTGGETPEQVREGQVSANFFDALGMKPVVGRGFVLSDEQQNVPQVAILSRGFWQQHFAASPAVIGKRVRLDGTPVTIIGVFPDVPLLMDAQVVVATPNLNPGMNIRRSHFMRLIARLKPGVTIEQGQADLDAIAHRLGEQYPDSDKGWSVWLQPLKEKLVGNVRGVLLALLCAVGLVLLIACANVANLLLVRAGSRQREVAIRAALGATRRALIRQFLAESLLLALAGGAAAVLLALWGVDALRGWGPAGLPRWNEIRVDGVVLGFALLVSLATGVLAGLAPAFGASKTDVQTPLRAGSGASRSTRHTKGGMLVIGEVAISLVLLISAGLATKSLWKLLHVDPGFQPAQTIFASIGFPYGEPGPRRVAFFEQLFERTAALPDIESAGAVSEIPLTGEENDGVFRIEGKRYPGGPGPGSYDLARLHLVTGDYFRTMRIPLLRGRYFSRQDSADSPGVAVVSEAFARKYFPGQDPVGKSMISDEGDPVRREIVGVVGAVRFSALGEEPDWQMYFPYAQMKAYSPGMHIVVRTRPHAAGIGNELRAAAAAIDPQQPLSAIRTLEDVVSASAAQPRFFGLLLGLFAFLAVALAAIGLYGVISYAVSRHTREIGIRMALGAAPADILRLTASEALRLIGIGLAAGWTGAYFAGRLLATRLFQVAPQDPAVFSILPIGLAAVALAACWIPARRAMRVDPAVSLRQD